MRAGFIDIGSNSIRFMTAEQTARGLSFSKKQLYTTRLAQSLADTGLLAEDRIAASLSAIRDICAACAAQGMPVYAYATSAVRDAGNRQAITGPVQTMTGGRLRVLSGEEEARYAFLAATGGKGGMLDVGGGSTQIVTAGYAQSFPIGCVRAKDLCGSTAMPAILQDLTPRLDRLFILPRLTDGPWTGVGGTVTTLCALSLGLTDYDQATVQGAVMTRERLANLLSRLSDAGDARRTHPLLEKRHDVILYGGAIVLYVLDRLGAGRLLVSDADGLEGYAMHVFSCM